MTDEKYKHLLRMRSPPLVKSMYRLIKDNDVKRAKARARLAARADTKAKARVSGKLDLETWFVCPLSLRTAPSLLWTS